MITTLERKPRWCMCGQGDVVVCMRVYMNIHADGKNISKIILLTIIKKKNPQNRVI